MEAISGENPRYLVSIPGLKRDKSYFQARNPQGKICPYLQISHDD